MPKSQGNTHRRAGAFALLLLLASLGWGALPVFRASGAEYDQGYGPDPLLPAPAPPIGFRGPRVLGWPAGNTPVAPAGFTVRLFARDIESPRWLYVLPGGDVLVAQSSFSSEVFGPNGPTPAARDALREAGMFRKSPDRVSLLRDFDGDGIVDLRRILLEGLDHPFGMALIAGQLYVAATNAIWRFDYRQGEMRIALPGTKVLDLPAGSPNPHWTRNLVASRDKRRLYVAVGSTTDVDVEAIDRKDPRRATILEVDPDAGTARVFASGLRNATGMDWDVSMGRLWTVVNERDHLGPDLPPDFLTSVERGDFYGWPYAYHGQNEDPANAGQRPDLVARSLKPDYALGSHTAPLGLAFQRSGDFPEPFRSGAFVSQHGSMRASSFSRPKVVFIAFENGRPAGPPLDFLTGFVADHAAREVYGRPVGLAQLPSGDLLVADDAGDCIWAITFQRPGGDNAQPGSTSDTKTAFPPMILPGGLD